MTLAALQAIIATAGRDGATAAPAPPRWPAKLPRFGSWELPFFLGKRAGYFRIMWITRRGWKRSPWAEEPGWKTISVGPFAIAVKLVVDDRPAWRPFRAWRHRFRVNATGELIEVDIIFATTRTWNNGRWSKSPEWQATTVGPFTIGIQVTD